MFQFRGFAHLAVQLASSQLGCPIRKSTDQFLFANPRGLSQLTTSFVASKSQGIPHTLFLTFLIHTHPFAVCMKLYLILNNVKELRESNSRYEQLAVSLCYARDELLSECSLS